ncbi:hypothetical protein [uncultured Cellulomonas sp.]|uniref:hypothetical protein n=1 Tax=uncultured Cellulomonas sp. TaxID=189682 RepID=UPI00262A1BBE|nr:hypothetical protein [uncultured Cellulomonas sp.]
MTADIIDALLWRTRSALRLDGAPLFAGHGLADPMYRPPRLPYASVTGPLSYTVEPERDLPRERSLTVRVPGYLAGTSLPAAAPVPAPGTLDLLLDGEVRLTVAVNHGADTGAPLTAPRAVAAAARVAAALHQAVADGGATVDGVPVTDAARLAELGATTVRWDDANRRFVMASGRRGPATLSVEERSSVGLALPTPHAVALGLGDGALAPTGRLVRHQVPAPIALAFDARVDLWAGSQRHLAALVESWARVTPTRCQLVLRPALLAADVPDGATEIPLQAEGEPATRWTRVQLEPHGGFADRRTGRAVTTSGGATADAAGLTLPTGATATLAFLDPPAVPDPTLALHPAPGGWALSTRLVAPAAAAGDHLVVAELEHEGMTALRLEVDWVDVPSGNGGPATLAADVRASATAADGTPVPAATVRVPAALLADGAAVHALVDTVPGRVAVFADDAMSTGAPVGPVPPPGGDGMLLRLGGAGGPAATLAHVHVLSRPAGPLDPLHRRSAAPATRWRPGDPVTLVRSTDGATPRGTAFVAVVVAVTDGVLHLDRPVTGTWPRHDTVVGARVVFSQQTGVRRRDDLASNLTRISLEHTVSGFVEPESSSVGTWLVESLDLQAGDRTLLAPSPGRPEPVPARTAPGAPGTRAELVPARALRSTVTTADAAGAAPEHDQA